MLVGKEALTLEYIQENRNLILAYAKFIHVKSTKSNHRKNVKSAFPVHIKPVPRSFEKICYTRNKR